MTNLILCGGVGSRLWPLSRTTLPKQFASILPGQTLFEGTVKRNAELCNQILVASNAEQMSIARLQLLGLGIKRWKEMVEPVGRNTAPAIALACAMLDPEELVLVTPSDHVISDQRAYADAVNRAAALARNGRIVTFGINPEYPETGFGYIEEDKNSPGEVLSFKEKPDAPTAAKYIATGGFYWNSGMFCFKAGVFLRELATHAPEVSETSKRAVPVGFVGDVLKPDLDAMNAVPSISVDYAVLERTKFVSVVPCSIGWSDLGSFDALYDHLKSISEKSHSPESVSDSAILSTVDPIEVGTRRNLILGDERIIALIDIEDMLVIDSSDALLIAKRGSSQKVKQVYDTLKKRGSTLADRFPDIAQEWGSSRVLAASPGEEVFRHELLPGSTHPLVGPVSKSRHLTTTVGMVLVTIEGVAVEVSAGSSISIPAHTKHLIANTSGETSVVVEVRVENASSAEAGQSQKSRKVVRR